ncbi:YheV family putative zinc ribbon protein [Marinobacter salicampi]|uniref:YheV family putative zinc ribbon protein n=1 Tax=Marinobacter salicampi TaxID=435907 RepID=UPI00140BB169|nr:YheV family putative zinc ribbon protein [Marinobacter salicampi]
MATPKRFIAGAVCPRCAEMDKITMYTTEEGQFRECVACGFADKEGESNTPAEGATAAELPAAELSVAELSVSELQTRVNTRKNTDDHTVKQVVFFKAGGDSADD